MNMCTFVQESVNELGNARRAANANVVVDFRLARIAKQTNNRAEDICMHLAVAF